MNSLLGRVKLPTKPMVTQFGIENCSRSTGTPACALLLSVLCSAHPGAAKLPSIWIRTKSSRKACTSRPRCVK